MKQKQLDAEVDRELAHHCLNRDPKIGTEARASSPCPIIEMKTVMDGSQTDCQGRTPLDRLTALLDIAVADLMDPENGGKAEARIKGLIYAWSYAIAMIQNPFYPDREAVTDAAWERYVAAHPEEEE